MKTINLFLIIYIVMCTNIAYGQEVQADSLAKAEMIKLNFLEGNWKGSGWMMGADREKHSFQQTEKISFKLDHTIMLIEGKGTSNGKIIHDAVAIVNYDKDNRHYNFRSYLRDGRSGVYKAELIEEKLYWYPNDNIRYIIYLNDEGQWFEIGEINKGGNWYQFFEMTLTKE
ncbi:hypothetical protein JKA74_00910 [Marivirga sp. S37H4]|uniref:DUF1579 domain-containing protein n=1 Tax=Marivirga aurantiaca TaxID=2802615 RepID=A0A935C896_9BACT|nr:hypothetical protein [Marivirga aurantiaca]MBK6263578.1 hypothetical protein [Marivirga aurantiaca]